MSKIICIYHSIDLDGWMSAAIVKKWWLENKLGEVFSDIEDVIIKPFDTLTMLGWNYGNDILDLSEYDSVIMCDISFPKEEMEHLLNTIDINFIWIDHHISAINTIPDSINGIRSPKFAACELTWKHLMQGMSGDPDKETSTNHMPEIVHLLGRYDCFGHKGTDEERTVLEFQYGARECIDNYEKAYKWLVQNGDTTVQYIHQKGVNIYAYLCTEAKWVYNMGVDVLLQEPIFDVNGTHCNNINRQFKAINRSRFNPVNFGIDYHADNYDGIMSFNYNKDKWTASLYNDNGLVDCSAIAKTLGGGGHKGASGFVMKDTSEFIKLLSI